MNSVLLDTHVVLWWFLGGRQLTTRARDLVADPSVRVLVSSASAWEIAIKHKAGKLDAAESLIARFQRILDENGFVELPISISHGLRAASLNAPHKDPFDRVLAAQAQLENIPLLSNDKVFDTLSVRRIW